MAGVRSLAAIVLAVTLGAASPARADDAAAPWSQGVTAAHKAEAKQLLETGNALFLEHKYAEALDAYRRAIAVWDHPAIRFNIVRCLIQLDRAVEASQNLDAALKYGATPLEDTVYAEAIAYQKLLANQTGELEVACGQPGVVMTLDGQPLASCPSHERRRVATGRHQLVAAKPGFLTRTEDVVVAGGTTEHAEVSLLPLAETAHIVHRWPSWIPWVVFGGGLAVAAGGALVEGIASSKIADFDRALVRDCSGPGCGPSRPIPAADLELESSAHTYGAIGVAVIAAGVAATATGATMLYLNRGRSVYGYEVAPIPGGATVGVRGSF